MWTATLIYLLLMYFSYLAVRHNVFCRILNLYRQNLSRPKMAENLNLQLQKILVAPNVRLQKVELVNFKFYTPLIKSLVMHSREYGAPISAPIKELIRAIRSEQKALVAMWQSFWEGVWQFLVVAFITWGFVIALSRIIQFQLGSLTLVMVVLLQVMGMFSYIICFLAGYFKFMGGLDKAFNTIYTIRSLLTAGLPLSLALKKSEFSNIPKSNQFLYINQRIEYLTSEGLSNGGQVVDQLNEVVDDLWEIQDNCYKKFRKALLLIKFTLLVIFFVPSYLLVSFDLISSLMRV